MMTLSLDDVRNKRFRMARKSGYEVMEVDEFVDEVEEAFGQLTDENSNLKKQVDSLRQSGGPVPAASPPQGAPAEAGPQPIVVTTGKEASSAVVRLVEMSTEQAERLLAEATEEATRIREEANRSAAQVTGDAKTTAERVQSEARLHAEQVQADARARAEKVDRDLEARRVQMFGELERQREELSTSVHQLRDFEAAYRASLTDHLRAQLEAVANHRAEPRPVPDGLRPGPEKAESDPGAREADAGSEDEEKREGSVSEGSPSNTPRLDALLGDQQR